MVLYHGDRPWSAPDRVVDLFERSDPGKYRLVAWGEDKAEGESRDDLVALVLGLARNLIGSGHGRPDVGLANGG